MRRKISFLLAAAMLLSLFSFVSCDEQTISDVANLALEIVENLPGETEAYAEEAEGSAPADETPLTEETGQETEPEPEPAPEPAPEPTPEVPVQETEVKAEPESVIDEDGWYDDRDSVALYIHTYGKLPPNYVSKDDAEDLYGWEGGALDQYAEGMAIGGSKYGNYEGLLPKKSGRQYYECDIGTVGTTARGAKRIVYSNDGLIYYTEDHYETFELLYGEE